MTEGSLILPPESAAAAARLHVTHWLPAGTPRALVLLAHGYAEHAGRYEHVADRLNKAGYAVFAIDHWGHGRSEGTAGFVPRFSVYVDGMSELLMLAKATHPGVPRLLLGHSMGGLIATLLLIERQSDFVAAALSGPAIVPAQPPSLVTRGLSHILSRLLPRLGVVALDVQAISRDPAVVDAYIADPLVYSGKIGARLGKELIEAMARAREGAAAIHLPLLLQHGALDRLAAPEGSQYLFDHVGSREKRLEIYSGLFHEIFNEPEKQAVLDDLLQWFDAQLTRSKAPPAEQEGASP